MLKYQIVGGLYRNIFKPLAFSRDAEGVHDRITAIGEWLENYPQLISWISYRSPKLKRKVLGIEFENPVGLAGGFDYDGHLAKVLKHVGFGFNTVGTITAKPYEGNPKPRLLRLPKSQALLVNKGFKSEGAVVVAGRLDNKNLTEHTMGISVGSSNLPQVNTTSKAVDDYLFTFDIFKHKKYVKYFELNISCPNTAMTESFTTPANLKVLVTAVNKLDLKQPVFVKMPNEIEFRTAADLVRICMDKGIRGFIFSNLVKHWDNPGLHVEEVEKIKSFRGNFSGKPTFENSNNLVAFARKKFGTNIAIIGCGGIFGPEDALFKLQSGADLVQLITGMIYQGPQLVGQINEYLDNKGNHDKIITYAKN